MFGVAFPHLLHIHSFLSRYSTSTNHLHLPWLAIMLYLTLPWDLPSLFFLHIQQSLILPYATVIPGHIPPDPWSTLWPTLLHIILFYSSHPIIITSNLRPMQPLQTKKWTKQVYVFTWILNSILYLTVHYGYASPTPLHDK